MKRILALTASVTLAACGSSQLKGGAGGAAGVSIDGGAGRVSGGGGSDAGSAGGSGGSDADSGPPVCVGIPSAAGGVSGTGGAIASAAGAPGAGGAIAGGAGAPGPGGSSGGAVGSTAGGGGTSGASCSLGDPIVRGSGPTIQIWVAPNPTYTGVLWTASNAPGQMGSGTFANSSGPSATFTCTALGQVTVTASTTCGASFTTVVDCQGIVLPQGPPGCLQLTSLTEPTTVLVGNTAQLSAGINNPDAAVTWTLSDSTLATLGATVGGRSTTFTCNGVGIEAVTATAGAPACQTAPGCPDRSVSFNVSCCGLAALGYGTIQEDPSSAVFGAEFTNANVTEAWTLSDPSLGTLSRTSGETTTFTCRAFGTETVTVTGSLATAGGSSACSTATYAFAKECDALPDGTARPGLCPEGPIIDSQRSMPVGTTLPITATVQFPDDLPFPGATYAWTASDGNAETGAGTFGDPAAQNTTFTCSAAGSVTLTSTATIAGNSACAPIGDQVITCCPPVPGLSASAASTTLPVRSSTSIAAIGFSNTFTGWSPVNFAGQTGSGVFGDTSSTSTTFTCQTPGQVTLTAFGQDGYPCGASASVVVTCTGTGDTGAGLPPECLRSSSSNPASVVFQSLGIIPDVVAFILPSGISSDGTTVVGQASFGFQLRAFRWTAAEGFVLLDGEEASSASADGSVIVGYQNPYYDWATRWTTTRDHFGLPYGPPSVARDVSDDGHVVVGFADYLGDLGGFIWNDASGLQFLPSFDRAAIHPTAVSRDGSIVVGTAHLPGSQSVGVRWTAQTGVVKLADSDLTDVGYEATPADVTSDGSVIGILSRTLADGSARSRAVKWTTNNQVVDLDPSGPEQVVLSAASADGSVFVGDGIWDKTHGLRDLATAIADAGGSSNGWELYSAGGLSSDGKTVVGTGLCGGETLGWIAHLP